MKKNRKRSTLIAGFLALLLLLSGTFAWTSISQRALNEKEGKNNIVSGGRIHDDYSKATGNKDIYGENYGTEDLYVRIKLSEYFEKGGVPLVSGTMKDNKNTWTPYGLPQSSETEAYRDYVMWELGGSKIFLPTFNTVSDDKSTDASKDAIDVLAGTVTAQGNGEQNAFTDGEVVPNEDDATITHTTKPTLTQGKAPISMETWKTLSAIDKVGDYWVIDADGWAYWANTLKPTQATSLLLTQLMYDDGTISGIQSGWYYGIDVIGEFATEEDKGDFNQSDHGSPSIDATRLINTLTRKSTYHVAITNGGNNLVLNAGETKQFTANVTEKDLEGNETLAETPITWSVSPASAATIAPDGTVTVSSELLEETNVTVTATAEHYNESTTFIFKANPKTKVKVGSIGAEFDFFGETYLHLKDLGDGNHLVQRKATVGTQETTRGYNGGPLDTEMKAYFSRLREEAKAIVQPVQINFITDDVSNDYARVTPSGEKKAFALSLEELNDVTGLGKAYPTEVSRISNTHWWLRTNKDSGNSWYIRGTHGTLLSGISAFPVGARPAMIINP